MRTVRLIILIWVFAAIIAGLFGEVTIAGESGSTTANFLNIGVGARAMGMGGAFTSIADDPSAVFWNPAGLRGIENGQAEFSHYSWYQDVKVENLQLALPGKKFSFGAGLTYLDFGEIQTYDEAGTPGEALSMHSLALAFSISTDITENISGGVTVKYIEQSFDLVKGTAIAGDIGMMARFGDIRTGLAITNFGSKVKFVEVKEDLPTAVRAGLSFRHFNGRALFSFEGHAPFSGKSSFHQGIEFMVLEQLYARSGFAYQTNALPGTSALSYNLGAGVTYGAGRFDYTFAPSDDFGNDTVHNFSISLTW
jgi:long-subunit fatty acid transport protein